MFVIVNSYSTAFEQYPFWTGITFCGIILSQWTHFELCTVRLHLRWKSVYTLWVFDTPPPPHTQPGPKLNSTLGTLHSIQCRGIFKPKGAWTFIAEIFYQKALFTLNLWRWHLLTETFNFMYFRLFQIFFVLPLWWDVPSLVLNRWFLRLVL